MEAFLLKVPDYLQVISLALAVLVLIATVVVKITPTPKDDEVMSKIGMVVFKIMAWLPFFGVDPRLKQMKQAFEDLEKKDEPPKTT